MTTTSLLETLQQQFTPSAIQQMSTSLGSNPSTTSTAIAVALPTILGGLASNAAQPEGAASLDRALNAHDGSILDNLGGLLGGGGGGIGGAILGHILGPKRGPVEQGVGRASGLDPQQTAKLLMMLAPIVMGVLGRMKKNNGIDASQLPDVLNQSATQVQKQSPRAGGFAGMLDANGDGSIVDDIGRIGGSMLGGMLKK